MCIVCVVQRWSRRIATMLPWLVIPLIGLWAVSQLLPPNFRFEVTSPRLACVLVLLVTLFWYEILMPQLSAWRARRSARLRERCRFQAIEMQKLKRTAIRRCRNCLTPYRDQNPGGGRFTCAYCGHISKRPVLEMPSSAMLTNNGFLTDLVGKSGRIWNGKAWSENGWTCGQDCSENGSWTQVSSSYLGKNAPTFFSGDEVCLAESSYSRVVIFVCKTLVSFFLSIRWLWRKVFRVGSGREDTLLDNAHKGDLSSKCENGVNYHESKGEKARRKAEEKRQARLEKELLEEEERKQREEVARLVEERRRLLDEKLEAEKDRNKCLVGLDRDHDNMRESEKRKQDKKKDKDKGSSKSNSDCEELEKKAGGGSERKREFDKRSDGEKRDFHKTVAENFGSHGSETGHGIKGTTNSFCRTTVSGSRYFDRVKGSFLSSSKAFNGANIFARGAHTSSNHVTKVNKSSGFGHSVEHVPGKFTSNGGDDRTTGSILHQPVGSNLQPSPAVQKKSWQQLFTRSSTADTNTLSRSNQKQEREVESHNLTDQVSPYHHLDTKNHFGSPFLFTKAPLANSLMSRPVYSFKTEPSVSVVGELPHDFIPAEAEFFEDPCYVSDPVSLLGSISESLDSFSLDLGSRCVPHVGLERPHVIKNGSTVSEVNRPSPIESPMSRLRVAEERHNITSSQLTCTPESRDSHSSPNIHEQGTWQMWGTPSLGQDGLSMVGGLASWLLPLGQNKSNQDSYVVAAASHKPMSSQFARENQAIPGTSCEKAHHRNNQNGGAFSPLGSGSNDSTLWLQKTIFQPFSEDKESNFSPLNEKENISRKELTYDGSSSQPSSHPGEISAGNCWSKLDWAVDGLRGSETSPNVVGGLLSTPDVQLVWSLN